MTQTQTPDDRRVALSPAMPTALAETKVTGMTVDAVAGRSDIERIETTILLPADYQYAIAIRGKKNADGTWDNTQAKVGITADGYDYLNRVLGCSFFLPEWVHDEHGSKQLNPIHRKDYIYLRMAAVWYTPLGQLIMASEDVEVDFHLAWMDARINSTSAVMALDENGLPLFDGQGNPGVRLDPKDELKALKTLSQLRTFGPRYAQTVARVRLLKMATGIRSLPGNTPMNRTITMTGYRDRLTPQERAEKAGATVETLYGGRPADLKPLTAGELAEVNASDPLESGEAIDRDLVAAHVSAEWTAEDMAEVDR
jgi:hypothetical protein